MPIPSEYRISLAQEELQMEVLHGFLSRSYWSPGIPREIVERAARNSLVAGAYHASGVQVGFARMATDHTTFGYLMDVFVLEEHRGKGLAVAMVHALLEIPEVQRFRRIMLATRDAHGVYERCGFEPMPHPELFMEIARTGLYQTGESVDPGDSGSRTIDPAAQSPYPLPRRIPVIRIEAPPEEEGLPQGLWPLPGISAAFYKALRINRM